MCITTGISNADGGAVKAAFESELELAHMLALTPTPVLMEGGEANVMGSKEPEKIGRGGLFRGEEIGDDKNGVEEEDRVADEEDEGKRTDDVALVWSGLTGGELERDAKGELVAAKLLRLTCFCSEPVEKESDGEIGGGVSSEQFLKRETSS